MAITEEKKTHTELCYKQLRRLLLHGQIPPGQRLTETTWAEKLGVHRGALREAMRLLLHEGLLRRGARGGFFVPTMEERDLDEVVEVQLALEVGAIRLTKRLGKAIPNLVDMRQINDSLEQMLREGFDIGYVEGDRRFHELLVEAASNQRLLQVYLHAPLPVTTVAYWNDEARRKHRELTVAEHRTLCDLLERGRIEEAIVLLRQHLRRGRGSGTRVTETEVGPG